MFDLSRHMSDPLDVIPRGQVASGSGRRAGNDCGDGTSMFRGGTVVGKGKGKGRARRRQGERRGLDAFSVPVEQGSCLSWIAIRRDTRRGWKILRRESGVADQDLAR
jgi:hypothetical protein